MSITEMEHAPPEGQTAHSSEHAHPSPAKYVAIAMLLAAVTGVEITLYYVELADNLMIGLLLALSAVKFVLVIGFFMHLRFDNPLLRRVFVAGMVLALAVYSVVLFSFHVFTR